MVSYTLCGVVNGLFLLCTKIFLIANSIQWSNAGYFRKLAKHPRLSRGRSRLRSLES